MKLNNIDSLFRNRGVMAVFEIENIENAIPVCKALFAGGISIVELILRTPAAETSIKTIKEAIPEMIVGAGILIQKGQSGRIKKLGADFASAPGYNPVIIRETKELGLPFVPSVVTPSELEAAISDGINVLRISPAYNLGRMPFLKSMNYQNDFLNLNYIPVGGVNEENLNAYASMPQVLTVGGTWITPKDLIINKQWDEISALAKRAMKIWNANKNPKSQIYYEISRIGG
ncbi:MAG: bifunctional 4-hydroxy-2-oxoglutarate aldolase/2-dehydro-3-deoxy-phosphogluconate aldolase [Endomicrobia bacterium]|nr:bifunctional 4-hydroxy-2-oxoglutarate aldolase/2-dehydro-3-deoxy-phosphogluconate aldolase [Endomicrobiia bacterium]